MWRSVRSRWLLRCSGGRAPQLELDRLNSTSLVFESHCEIKGYLPMRLEWQRVFEYEELVCWTRAGSWIVLERWLR